MLLQEVVSVGVSLRTTYCATTSFDVAGGVPAWTKDRFVLCTVPANQRSQTLRPVPLVEVGFADGESSVFAPFHASCRASCRRTVIVRPRRAGGTSAVLLMFRAAATFA